MNATDRCRLKEAALFLLGDIIIVTALWLASCCSLLIPPPGLTYRCAVECPARAEVEEVLAAFSELEPDFYTGSLDVTFVEKNGEWAGRTYDRDTVAITSLAVLPHELYHVLYWRKFGDPDRDHELGNGPWTEETNEKARSIRIALGI